VCSSDLSLALSRSLALGHSLSLPPPLMPTHSLSHTNTHIDTHTPTHTIKSRAQVVTTARPWVAPPQGTGMEPRCCLFPRMASGPALAGTIKAGRDY
jgi:hypothetical protein